jgi:D-3-phosphoglycerate dehydrogenase
VALAVAEGGSVDRIETQFFGRLADRDTRLLSIQALLGALAGHTEEDLNAVNAHVVAEERGIRLVETKETTAREYTDLVRVHVTASGHSVRVAGTLFGRRNRPHLLEAWGHRFNVQLEEHITLFRYQDLPGMLGRVGTLFGEHGVNIISAAVGRLPDEGSGDEHHLAAMAITTASPVPGDVVAAIVHSEGFVAGHTVAL